MEVKVIKQNGANCIAVDGKVIDSLAFKSFRPTENNVSDFYRAGVRVFHVYCSGLKSGSDTPYSLYGETWFGDGDYRFENLDRQIDFFIENAPEGYLFINVHLDTRDWWLKENEGRTNTFTHLSQTAADEKWRRDTADYLRALIRHTEEKYGDRTLGYFLLGGYTTEWFSEFDYELTHPIKLAAYRKYVGDENAEIPTKEELERADSMIFLDPVSDKKVIEYRKFHNELISDTVLFFCREAEAELMHKKLVGVFFGYVLECRNARIFNVGHLDLDRVNESDDVDLIATPSSYQFRNYDDSGAYMILTDSVSMHGKTYFSSFDNFTFLTRSLRENSRRLCTDESTLKVIDVFTSGKGTFKRQDFLPTREMTIHAMRREMMMRLTKGCGTWWFDMFEGWFYDDGLMAEAKNLVERSQDVKNAGRKSISEVALFVSAKSLYYVNKCSGINTEVLCNQRGALGKMGAPYDTFSLADLENIDLDRYKLIIFPDAYHLNERQRKYINERIKADGRSVLFVGACDYAGDDGLSLARVSEMCEMNISALENDESKVSAFGSTYGYAAPKNPTLCAEGGEALGYYAESQRCALAMHRADDHTVFFSGLGNLSHEALREIARLAGVHIYAEGGAAVYVNETFVGVYNTKEDQTVLDVGCDGDFVEIFGGKEYSTKGGKLTLPTGECPAQLLMRKKKA